MLRDDVELLGHGEGCVGVEGGKGRLELLQGGQPLSVQVQAEKLVRQHLDEKEDVKEELLWGPPS